MKNRKTFAVFCVLIPLAVLAALLVGAAPGWAQGAGTWAVVTTQSPGYGEQSWQTAEQFPDRFIETKWDEGYSITEVTYGGGKWAVVMTEMDQQIDQPLPQSWSKRSAFPEDVIEERWDEGYSITDLAYGGGEWVVVMTENPGYGAQSWITDGQFPEQFIQTKWDEGYIISELAYGDGLWAVVMTKMGDYAQSWSTHSAFPEEIIQEQWDAGYNITGLAYGDGQWAVVTTQIGDYAEAWSTDAAFPQSAIAEGWQQGYHVTSLAFGGGPEEGSAPRSPQQPQEPAAPEATGSFVQIACSNLRGSGSYSDPVVIGVVRQPTLVSNCPRLRSGSPYNRRYFSITLQRAASAEGAAGAVVVTTADAVSAVHPRLASTGGVTLLTSLRDGYWIGNPNVLGEIGRYLPLAGLEAGTYYLGVEKLDSPVRSLQTPNFDLVIIP